MNNNAIFLEDSAFNDKFVELKNEFRRHMNGEASAMMTKQNVKYGANYGVSQQHIKEIASQFQFTIDECKRLWASNIREAKLVAAIHFAINNATAETLLEIVQSIDTTDMAEQTAFFLFGKTFDINNFISKLIDDKSTYAFGLSYMSAGRYMQNGNDLSASTIDVLLKKLPTHKFFSITEFRAISFFLRQLIRTDINHFEIINNTLKQMQNAQPTMVQQLFNEIEDEKYLLSV